MADDGIRDLDRYRNEARAYTNLKKSGLCGRGIVPKVYGLIECLDPNLFLPTLRHFLKDAYWPNAILLEYLPDVRPINFSLYSKERERIIMEGIRQIHELALTQHGDIYTKNIFFVPGSPERIMWADFDVAVSYKDPSSVTHEGQRRLDMELESAQGLLELVVCIPAHQPFYPFLLMIHL